MSTEDDSFAPSGPDLGSAARLLAGDAGRQSALDELVSLMLDTPSVEDYLAEVAGIAARVSTSTSDVISCGITLRRGDQPLTVASSDAVATALDEAQYGRGRGPCLQAMETASVVSSPDLAIEDRWGDYVAHALAYGVASSLSMPLIADGISVGALNLYSRVPHSFDAPDRLAAAQSLAGHASAMLTLLLRQAQQAELSEQLREALASRAQIDQAIGILMGQQRCSASEAFAVLRTASQHRNRKLRDIAADVITTTSGAPPEPSPFSDSTRRDSTDSTGR